MATRAASSGARTLPKLTYTGWGAGVEKRDQLGRKRSLVGQDPRAGLHDIEVRRSTPRGQGGIGCQPRAVGEDVVADVVHRRQA